VLAEGRIVSVGNFDIGPLATALDFARIALAPVVTSANERLVKLLQAPFSGLPAGLAAPVETGTVETGTAETGEDALSELAVAGQAITVEARLLAAPVSYELASSVKAEGIEDRTTNAPLSARRLAEMVGLIARVAAIELVVAAQAIDLRRAAGNAGAGGDISLGAGTGRAYRMVRELIPFIHASDTLPHDLEPVVGLVTRGDPASELEVPPHRPG
jgi:histidine ammonia-lyase